MSSLTIVIQGESSLWLYILLH